MYASSMDGIFDSDRRRPAPAWLKEQLRSPREGTQLYSAPALTTGGTPTVSVPANLSANESLDLDEDGVAQG